MADNKEYIEREQISGVLPPTCQYGNEYSDGYNTCLETVKGLIREAPAINPDDLRQRGRWITERCNHVQHRFKNPEKWVIHKCSLCGYSNGRKQSNYCPNCGAKMDAADNNVGGKIDSSDELSDWQQSMLRTFGGDADV